MNSALSFERPGRVGTCFLSDKIEFSFFASETLDEEIIQSAISSAIKTLQDQHRAELEVLKQEMQLKIDQMDIQMKELGKQVATQTYQALVTEDSPLVTKKDHAYLQQEISIINSQLSTLIRVFTNSNGQAPLTNEQRDLLVAASPPRTGKRLKQNRTPEKPGKAPDPFTQDSKVPSAASDSDEGMEGCED